jgi:tetratricopeptide (TPR) repeat protein
MGKFRPPRHFISRGDLEHENVARAWGILWLAVATESLFSSRFAAGERRTTLVGRAAEMREFERAYAMAAERGQTHTVTLLGGAGIGKTRLVRDFLLRAREGGHAPQVFRGTAREAGPAYEVFARALRARFGIVEGMDAGAANAQVRTQLASVLEDRKVGDVAYFLGQLLDLDFQRSPLIKAIEGDPQQVRSMRRAVIKNFLEADASKGADPPVLVFDDLQWAHDDSLDLLGSLIDTLRAPILLVCIARPNILVRRDGWRRHGGERHTLIELSPLGEADAAAVLHDLLSPCGDAPSVHRLVDEAVVMGGGNPSVLEQVVRIYHETGVLETTDDFDSEHWTVHPEKLEQVKLSLSVEDAVQARIAVLSSDERGLLERAAAMGGVFWLGGLIATRRHGALPQQPWEGGGESGDVVEVRRVLTDLVDRDYLLRLPDSTFAGDEEYVFKHNLEREALVGITPQASARGYHRAIADWLAFRENVEASEEYLEMLARHREKAGATAMAAVAYVKAGDVARSRYANAKSAELYAKGLGLLEECDHADEDLRLRALHHVGDVLQSLGRNDEALRAFEEMLTRAWRLDLRNKGGAAHSRIGRLYRETGRLEQADRHLTAALALFGQSRDERGVGSTLDDIGKLHWLNGDYTLALEYTLRGLAMRRKLGDRRSIALSLNNLGLVQQDSGNTKGALEAFEPALRIRRDIGDLVGVCITLNNLGTVAQDMRDDRKALALFQEAYEVAKETGDRNRIALILTNLGETHNRLGDAARAVAMLRQAEDVADELGDKLGLAEAARGLGKAYLAQREYTKARECTQRSVDLFAETGSKVQLGIALRSLGEVTMAASAGGVGISDAADELKRSIAIFEEIGNDVELARSCRAYAELLRGTPEHASDPAVAAEAQRLARRAEEILAKMRAQAAAKEKDRGLDEGGP